MSTQDVNSLQAQMARIRRDLDDDVQAAVGQVRELADWRNLVRRQPLVCLAAAAAVGFLIVPKRLEVISPSAETLLELAKKNQLVVQPKSQSKQQAAKSNPMISMLTGAIMRSAMTLVGQQVGELVTGLGVKADDRRTSNQHASSSRHATDPQAAQG